MSKWIVMPEGSRWTETDRGATHEQVYSMEGHWYKPSTRIAILDTFNGQTKVFTREQDSNGNLIQVLEVKA